MMPLRHACWHSCGGSAATRHPGTVTVSPGVREPIRISTTRPHFFHRDIHISPCHDTTYVFEVTGFFRAWCGWGHMADWSQGSLVAGSREDSFGYRPRDPRDSTC